MEKKSSKKIIAVIPARSGSVGIPNKNLKILNGKPLIAYSIENAIKSKIFTEIIVSSDSDKILGLALQYKLSIRKRPEELCKDHVTLDEVIYDAIKNKDAEVIVTLQPTSPTLNVLTLTNAINYFFENNFDTLISGQNSPHLSWSLDSNGVFIPNYEKRLNRQFLPNHYIETGAFFITKKEFVKQNSRFGNKVGIYEISDDEAIDIDSYNDFNLANITLNKKRIAFYTNGNSDLGTGHIKRVIALANELNSKPIIFFNSKITDKSIFQNSKHLIFPIKDNDDLIDKLIKYKIDTIINDTLINDKSYIYKLKKLIPSLKIVNFDDPSRGSKNVNISINPFYEIASNKMNFNGHKYFIFDSIIFNYKPIDIKSHVKNVFISFGGSDPMNYTLLVLSLLKNNYPDINFHIVLGPKYKNYRKILDLFSKISNFKFYHSIDFIFNIISICDIAITSRGTTAYELAFLGVPTISLSQNNIENNHNFISAKNGFLYLGFKPKKEKLLRIIDLLFKSSKNFRKRIQVRLLKNDLNQGLNNVLNLIYNL